MKNKGFTLMELIATVAVLSVLVLMAVPAYNSIKSRVLEGQYNNLVSLIETTAKKYLLEVNFYSGGGSKLNEVARSYTELAPKVNSVKGFEFVWVTDGIGWFQARNKLEEAFYTIPSIYNLTSIKEFIKIVK